jgi:CHAD domain-containing protein
MHRALSRRTIAAVNTRLELLVLNFRALTSAGPDGKPFAHYARRLLRRRVHQVRKRAAWRHDDRPKVIHRARKRFRRARYLAEFLAQSLGTEIRVLAAALRKVERCLGRVHDMDRAADFAEKAASPPKSLWREIRRRRKKAIRRALKQFKAIPWRANEGQANLDT